LKDFTCTLVVLWDPEEACFVASALEYDVQTEGLTPLEAATKLLVHLIGIEPKV
jgi:hypothetical protein